MGSALASLILASNSGHTPWWIGLPILVVVLISRVGFWRRRRMRRGSGERFARDDRDDKRD
jgi:hypothetical protein